MRTTLALAAGLGLAAAAALGACSSTPAPAPVPAVGAALGPAELARAGEDAGIHNMAEVFPGLYRGAQPEGDASFALLTRLGVRTVLSVDGSRPDAEGAQRHGIRYVHIPIEYAGISRAEQVKIARVARDAAAEGALFVHCHHGRHRGPAACAIAMMTLEGTEPAAATAMMKAAGTDPRYEGLYADVAAFRPVTAEELASVGPEDLPPVARVPDFVGAMIALDETFARMGAVKQAGWRTPEAMPDVTPAHEARILAERFREIARRDEVAARPADFRGWLGDAEKSSWALEEALRAGDGPAAGAALDRVGASCASCHDVYRNRKSW